VLTQVREVSQRDSLFATVLQLTQCDQVLFDYNNSEPNSQLRLLSSRKKI